MSQEQEPGKTTQKSYDRLDIITDYIFNRKKNVAITGVGGVGKSYLISQLADLAKEKGINCALTSTTGVSAYNLGNGAKTIHSYLGVMMPNYIPEDVDTFLISYSKKILRKNKYKGRWLATELLIIDEVSMLGGTFLELIDSIAKLIRKNNKPFGGIQVVFSYDMLQLPPVKDVYPFESTVWKELNFQYFVLNKAHRFASQTWTDLLKRARLGKLTQEDKSELKICLSKDSPEGIQPTIIFSKNMDVESFNIERIQELGGKSKVYHSVDEVVEEEFNSLFFNKEKKPEVTNKLNGIPSNLKVVEYCNKQQIALLNSNLNIGETVELKIGAQVMLLFNFDLDLGLVNGSLGIVHELDDDAVGVEFFKAGYHRIPVACFTIETEYDMLSRKIIPLKLAWASTIHKCQGLTLDCVEIDIGRSIFSPNQAYVALSRCKSLDGLYISELMFSKIYPDKKALQFEEQMQSIAIQLE